MYLGVWAETEVTENRGGSVSVCKSKQTASQACFPTAALSSFSPWSAETPGCFGSAPFDKTSLVSFLSVPRFPQLALENSNQKVIDRIPFREKADLSVQICPRGGLCCGLEGAIHYFLFNNIPIFSPVPPPKRHILKHFAP